MTLNRYEVATGATPIVAPSHRILDISGYRKPPHRTTRHPLRLERQPDDLIRHRTSLKAEIRKAACDIDHIEAAIRLFNPDSALVAFKAYIIQHTAKKGSVNRFILNMLREATAPITATQITDAWITDRGLQCDDSTRVVLRKRIGAALGSMRRDGILRNEGVGADGFKASVVA